MSRQWGGRTVGWPDSGVTGPGWAAVQECDKVRLRREAKKAKGFYVEDEPKVVFAIRIRGINDMHPKVPPPPLPPAVPCP